jgi:hypothetical protein
MKYNFGPGESETTVTTAFTEWLNARGKTKTAYPGRAILSLFKCFARDLHVAGFPPIHQPVSSMASKSRKSKGRDGVLTGLDVAIQLLSVAKDACSVFPHAQIALGSACTLLTIIRVPSLLSLDPELPIHVYSGHDGQQKGFC